MDFFKATGEHMSHRSVQRRQKWEEGKHIPSVAFRFDIIRLEFNVRAKLIKTTRILIIKVAVLRIRLISLRLRCKKCCQMRCRINGKKDEPRRFPPRWMVLHIVHISN